MSASSPREDLVIRVTELEYHGVAHREIARRLGVSLRRVLTILAMQPCNRSRAESLAGRQRRGQ